MANCSIGFYEQNGRCEPCGGSCYACSGNATSCTRCYPGTIRFNDKCVSTCPNGYFTLLPLSSSSFCMKCSTSCATCFGTATNCTSCASPKLLLPSSSSLSSQGECRDSCDLSVLPSSKIRLVGGMSPLEGVVEVYHNGRWGTICANGWSLLSATVVCRQLLLGTAVRARSSTHLIGGLHNQSQPFWLTNVTCGGTERSLAACYDHSYTEEECVSGRDAAVQCSGPKLSALCLTAASCPRGFAKVPLVQGSGLSECVECDTACFSCQSTNSCASCRGSEKLHSE